MNILITNTVLTNISGTSVYVKDLALALKNKPNVHVEIFSPNCGELAEDIRQHDIHVVDTLEKLSFTPDIIHIHHIGPAISVLKKFPYVPAIFFCHDRISINDMPIIHPQIIRYIAVDYNCRDRFLEHGVPAEKIEVIFNWVDTKKFLLKETINPSPKKAAVFSNYASENNYLPMIRKACEKAHISLDIFGENVGNVIKEPEQVLGSYDIIFAKAKAAIEAMATGAGVILCDFRGIGELVMPNNFSYFQKYNFGMRVLNRPFSWQIIQDEIKKYSASEIQQVATMIRHENNLEQQIEKLFQLYQAVIATAKIDSSFAFDWHSLKNKLKNYHFFELFYDTGHGFNSAESVNGYYHKQGILTIAHTTKSIQTLKLSIHLDSCVLKIKKLVILDAYGVEHGCQIIQHNAIFRLDSFYIFETVPELFLSIPVSEPVSLKFHVEHYPQFKPLIQFASITAPVVLPVVVKEKIIISTLKSHERKILFLNGWSGIENWGIWTNGNMAMLAMASKKLPEKFKIKLTYTGVVSETHKTQTYEILDENETLLERCFFEYGLGSENAVTVPMTIQKTSNYVVLKIKILHPYSPSTDGSSTDTRMLGMGIKTIEILD